MAPIPRFGVTTETELVTETLIFEINTLADVKAFDATTLEGVWKVPVIKRLWAFIDCMFAETDTTGPKVVAALPIPTVEELAKRFPLNVEYAP